MNKLLKKVCGFLCMGLTFLFVGNIKAATPNVYEFEFSNLNVENGKVSTNLTIWNSLGQGIMGDVNKNGVVELIDAQNVLKYSTGNVVDGISDTKNLADFMRLADMDGNGKILLNDAQKVLKIALRIEGTQYASWQQSLTSDEISSLSYVVVTGYSNLYSAFEEYYEFADGATTDTSDSDFFAQRDKLLQALNGVNLSSSADNETISSNLGTKKVDNIYVYVVAKIKDGTSVLETSDFIRYDVSDDSNWEFLTGKDDNSNVETAPGTDDEDKKDEASKNESSKEENSKTEDKKDETKIEVETETEVKTETKNESKKEESKKEIKEETVKNPGTGVAIPLVGSVVTIISSVVVKKKNLFNRI